MITYPEPDILECEVKWALESITMNKASGGDGLPVELFQILKDNAVKVLHSICQQIANIRWIMEKAREFQKNIYFCFVDYAKAFDFVDHNKLWKILKQLGIADLPLEKSGCRSGSNSYNWTWNNRLVPNRKRTASRLYIVPLPI